MQIYTNVLHIMKIAVRVFNDKFMRVKERKKITFIPQVSVCAAHIHLISVKAAQELG